MAVNFSFTNVSQYSPCPVCQATKAGTCSVSTDGRVCCCRNPLADHCDGIEKTDVRGKSYWTHILSRKSTR